MNWLFAVALAAEFDVLADDSVGLAAAGRCADVEVRLERRVDRNPDDLGARLALDACRIGGNERTTGERDLASLFHVGAPFEPALVAKGRVLDAAQRARLQGEAQLAATMVVRALSKLKAFGAAQAAWADLEPRVGTCGILDAARIGLEHAQNGVAQGWKAAAVAMQRHPDSPDVWDEVALLTFEDATPATGAVLDALLLRGRPTAKLNVFYGLARGGRGAECLLLIDKVTFTHEWQGKAHQVQYRCATAAGDLAAADSIAADGLLGLELRLRAEHAAMRLVANRPADALALVAGSEGSDSRTAEVTVRALVALGRRDELAAFAKALPTGSIPRLSAAVTLFNNGDRAIARELVANTCTEYTEQNAVLCSRME